ncbi:MAG: hypothetical protein KH339_08625 [Firmicutes bacterium]|nr:hypothetical protein [Bacillota bacterium]
MPVLSSDNGPGVRVDVPAWLELVNERLNSADSPVTEADLASTDAA